MAHKDENQYRSSSPDIGTNQPLPHKAEGKKGFAQRLSFILNRLKLSDAEFSRRSGVPKNTVSRYRKAESLPEAQHLFTVARTLEVDPEWLVTGRGTPTRTEEAASSDMGRMASLFHALDEEARQLVLRTATLLWSRPAPAREVGDHRDGQMLHQARPPYAGEDESN